MFPDLFTIRIGTGSVPALVFLLSWTAEERMREVSCSNTLIQVSPGCHNRCRFREAILPQVWRPTAGYSVLIDLWGWVVALKAEGGGGGKEISTLISCFVILSDCSSLCTHHGYRTSVLRLLVQIIDRRLLEAVHLVFQSGLPDDVSLLLYLFLQEYIICTDRTGSRLPTGRHLAVLMSQVFCVALDQFFQAFVDRQ